MGSNGPRESLFAIAALELELARREATGPAVAARWQALLAETPAELRAALTAQADSAPAAQSIGHYRLLEEIGRGGQAVVYLGEDQDLLRRQVAVKVVPLLGPTATAAALRLRREIELVAKLEIEGLCPVYDCGVDGDRAWIAMRYVAGRTLGQELAMAREMRALPDRAAIDAKVAWFERVARIVHAVHVAGVVHRDLKPSNIMVREDGQPVVLDFGVARAVDDVAPALTQSHAVPGTPAYMAPEQVQGVSSDRSVDVWALGVILFETLTLAPPFAGATAHQVQQSILDAAHPPLRQLNPAVPRDLEVVVGCALSKEPAHRYRTAQDLADDLARWRERRPILARPAGVGLRVRRFVARNLAASVAVAAAFVAITAGLIASTVLLSRAEQAQRFWAAVGSRYSLDALRKDLREFARDDRLIARFGPWYARGQELIGQLPSLRVVLAEMRRDAIAVDDRDEVSQRRRAEQRVERDALAHRVREYEAARANSPAAGDAKRRSEAEQALSTARELLANAEARLLAPLDYRFADPLRQSLHDWLAATIEEIGGFAEMRPGRETALAGRVLWRETLAIRRASLVDHAATWQAAIARIAAPDGLYRGLQLGPQEGLVPLGPDPHSGLEEFAHLASGRSPERDAATGQFVPRDGDGIVLVLLPGGECVQGVDSAQLAELAAWQSSVAAPRVRVELAPFFFGKHEVTQAQWAALSNTRPSDWRPDHPFQIGPAATERHPVERVSYAEATRQLQRAVLVLPTEAQWEYACRAGTTTGWHFGGAPDAASGAANFVDDRLASWYGLGASAHRDSFPGHAPVGSFAANAFGLHDLHGNVREWCADLGDYRARAAAGTGERAAVLPFRGVRGGSFRSLPVRGASHFRDRELEAALFDDLGVRAARPVLPSVSVAAK